MVLMMRPAEKQTSSKALARRPQSSSGLAPSPLDASFPTQLAIHEVSLSSSIRGKGTMILLA